jgi:rhodanese-related sulfurtransferase
MALVDVHTAHRLIQQPPPGLVVLDVRTPDEFAAGHLGGAVLVDFYDEDFPARVAALDRAPAYLVYCRSGARSAKTAELMAQLGFAEVSDLDGGILAWADAGLPVDR